MKLYVFQVNNGSTLTFDTELAVQTVLDLKHAIQVKYKISTQHQVLVVNGGECMVAERRVCSYSAGTDTNPIFLFNKEMILCDRAPTIPKTTFSIENEMELKVEESLMMPAVFHTVASRTQLAVEMFEVAKKLCSFCERLVHDEHLQHQGWAAIMANLDDCTLSYQKLLWKFDTAYSNYQLDFEEIKFKLTKLGTAVSVMAKIPLLECLTRNSYRESLEKSSSTPEKDLDETEEEKSTDSVLCSTEAGRHSKSPSSLSAPGASPSEPADGQEMNEMTDSSGLRAALQDEDAPGPVNLPSFNVTLLDWINVQDRPNDVESVVRKCFDSINRLDPRIIQPFLAECRDTIAKLDNQNMKAIKGLEDRLYALDQMIASCKKLVNEQNELAQGFLANQKRAEHLKDTSVLPDLCLSHANQLMIMLTNHRKLLDIKQKCTTAKQELANNLQVRLKWCCYVMLHADQDGEKLQALLRLLTELMERVRVVEALSTVPQMYCLAVVEVVRRKTFIGHYREWACALVKDGKKLYEAEKYKRETFGKLFRKSFLRNRLFKGLDSWPPTSFCTRKPRRFDFELPEISLVDLQYLKTCCPTEVQPYLMVPTLCDFEPLNQHVEMLHHLVQAAQSVDEMSQTITDLLSEQRASCSQSAQRSSVVTPRSESTHGATTPTSSKAPSSLHLQGPPCQPQPVPVALEDLSPDSIDAQTFDFETIGHPIMDPVLQQGSLDLDSLVESPESDFMSAVNEFVIEENLTSPNPISDPTSPEMMVESLYSSVINAIDSKRMLDTTTLERENTKIAALKRSIDKYCAAAEDSQFNLRSVKDDLYHFRGMVLKEHRDFGFSLKTATMEMRNIVDTIRRKVEEEMREQHQDELHAVRQGLGEQIRTATEENRVNKGIVKEVQRTVLELEGRLERKQKELTQLESEKDCWSEVVSSHADQTRDLEKKIGEQGDEIQDLSATRAALASQLEALHVEVERVQDKVRQELEVAERCHLEELEARLKQQHQCQLDTLSRENQEALERQASETSAGLAESADRHAAALRERDSQMEDLASRAAELADLRCKLEVELALKESEMEEARLLFEEAKVQQAEALKADTEAETQALGRELAALKRQLLEKSEQHERGLDELRTLLRSEKDRCISELVEGHEDESASLRRELAAALQQARDAEKLHEEAEQRLRHDLDQKIAALRREKEEQLLSFQEREEHLRTVNCDLQSECDLFARRLEQDPQAAQTSSEKTEALKVEPPSALKELMQQKEDMEKRLLHKIQQLEKEFPQRISSKGEAGLPVQAEGRPEAGAPLSLDSALQERLQQEKASLQTQMELLERRKNEEMQNLKTLLIAEQQTNFNTVLTHEKLKKEQIINELSEKLKKVTQQQEKDKALIESLSEDRASVMQEKKQLEEDLNRLRSTTLVSSSFFGPNPTILEAAGATVGAGAGACASDPFSDLDRLASVAPIRDDDHVDSAVEASMVTVHDNILMMSEEKQRILLLERTLHMKEEENKRLSQRLMSQSMSSVSSRHSEKIAIRDFQVGDLVLIILDERHDNYVLFTVGPTLYFLHSESLTALDLKPASGTSRRPWVLGKVMEKEYCQAKKAQNRFKVPLGTKFYRVKAVPWNKKV